MIPSRIIRTSRRKAVWGPKRSLATLVVAVLALGSNAFAAPGSGPRAARAGRPNSNAKSYKLDGELSKRSNRTLGSLSKTRVIVELAPGQKLPLAFKQYAKRNGDLNIINGSVIDVPNGLLNALAANPSVLRVHYDRPARKHDYRTVMTVGSRAVSRALGYTGAGIGIAIIDSGISSWHDDLTTFRAGTYPYGNQRVSAFVDFVNGQASPYDDDGHGSHVAGIIAGNGFDSNGKQAGVAPEADVVVLKALDANGVGTISNVIQALDWVLANRQQYNIRVVNLSVGAGINESYWTDPLTLAAKRVADSGVVVVAAAGNAGKNALGEAQYGGVDAPANAPWVLTVGASSTMGTITRDDDTMASFSSHGPTYLDWAAKPDLVAPGVGSVSLAVPGSNFYVTKPGQLLEGSFPTLELPYMSLSGTSMAAPVVSGTVALMLQANPHLTPNAVKAILQYTAQNYSGYDALTQGAGFLNAVGAVRLARFYATAQPGAPMPTSALWSKQIIWGNHQLSGGYLNPGANAFDLATTWGIGKTDGGDNIVWGTIARGDNIVWGTGAGGDNIVWGTAGDGDNIVWGTSADGDNIVWGTDCGGADCDNIVWGTAADGDNIVWGTAARGDNIVWGTGAGGDNIVWGTGAGGDNIVWGTGAGGDNIVWGTGAGGDNIVWGTSDGDNIVWGTAGGGDNIVWGTGDRGDNIVWGTSDDGDNIVWGTYSGGDNIVWGTSDAGALLFDVTVNQPLNWVTLPHLFARMSDEQIFAFIVAMTSPAPYIGGIPPAPPTDGPAPVDDPGILPPQPLPLDLSPVEPFDPLLLPLVEPMNLDLLPPPVAPVLGGL
jgi:serine protease AprX